MKRTLFSLMALVLVFALVGAGVVAWFWDTEASVGNVFTAGTLNLVLTDVADDGTEGEAATWVFGDIAPGGGGSASLTIQNTGSLPGFIDLSNVIVTNTEGVNPESEADILEPGDLGANLWITVSLPGVLVYNGLLNGFAAPLYPMNFPLAAGASTTLVIAWNLPVGVGNAVQGDSATLSFTVELDQTAD